MQFRNNTLEIVNQAIQNQQFDSVKSSVKANCVSLGNSCNRNRTDDDHAIKKDDATITDKKLKMFKVQ